MSKIHKIIEVPGNNDFLLFTSMQDYCNLELGVRMTNKIPVL